MAPSFLWSAGGGHRNALLSSVGQVYHSVSAPLPSVLPQTCWDGGLEPALLSTAGPRWRGLLDLQHGGRELTLPLDSWGN